ncbi:hypothetical protein Pfo_001286 [Paulownia fortunei]|nr:hypothetical protein Pfo_001286 [Paulownia fortunei]
MDINEVLSVGKSSQSMATKGVCILVVNDDLTCNNIVAEMLQRCNYQVMHIGGVLDVLNAIWETKDRLDLVLTNAHKLESNGMVIVQHIQKKLNLPVILMCADKMKIVSKGEPFSFAAYVLKGLSKSDVNNLWQSALEKEKDKMVAACQEENVKRASMFNVAFETNKTSASISEAACFNQRNKRKEPPREKNEKSEGSEEDPPMAKKPRVVWTIEMHQKFLEAIEVIGYDKAVPKKIVEVMGIPGLTRENVASHLQKFRGSMKRTQDTAISSLAGSSTTKELEGLCVLSSPSASRLKSLQMNMAPLPQSSFISTAKESVRTLKSQYLNTHNEFSFGTTSERKIYTNVGGFQFNRSGVDKLQQKYVPNLQLTPNFRIYGDQMKSMLLSIGENSSSGNYNQSRSGKFVGYRLTSDGNSIVFGKLEASINDKISRETLVSTPETSGNQSPSYIQHNRISDQNPLMSTSCISQQTSLLGSPSGEASFQCQPVLGSHGNENPTQSITTSKPQLPVQPLGVYGNANTEKCLSLLDQDTLLQSMETLANAIPFQNPSENDIPVQNASTPSSIFPLDQDFSMPLLETPENDFPVQNSVAFLEGISEQHYSPSSLPQMVQSFDDFLDDALLKGTGSTCPQFDWEEFDDTLFEHDD